MESITKNKVIMITVVPTLVFALLDIMTTYFGVCFFGGVEMNYAAIVIAQKFGFIILGIYHVAKNMFIGGLFAFYMWHSRNDELSKMFLMVVIVLYLTDFANVVVLNVNTLLYQVFGVGFASPDEQGKDVSIQEWQRIDNVFDSSKFCRLI